MENLKVAAVVMHSEVGKKVQNLDRMECFAGQAAEQGAQVVCFPEMNISGYGLRQEMDSFAEPIPGPSTKAVLEMAWAHGVLILAGLAEKGGEDEFYISQIAAGPEGSLGVYRKVHLGPPEEGIYRAGKECPVFSYGKTLFGMELCFDGHFPELTTILALKGAEVIFLPHASPRETWEDKRQRWLRYLSARAYDNSVFLVAFNQTGEAECDLVFPGAAFILNPRAEVMTASQEGGEGTIVAESKKDTLQGVRSNPRGFFLRRRRPELYRDLINPIG